MVKWIMKVERKRHIAKTITYRLLSSLIGFIIIYLSTNSINISLGFSLFEFFYKPVQYYIHERIWYRYIKFGLK